MPANALPEANPQIQCCIADPSEPCTLVIRLKHGRPDATRLIALLSRLVDQQDLGTLTKFALGDHL